MPSDLERENQVVLSLGQALLGLVSPAILGVSVEVTNDSIVAYFAVGDIDDEIKEDIGEVIGDLDAFIWPDKSETLSKIHVGPADETWEGRRHRLVFLAKTNSAGASAAITP